MLQEREHDLHLSGGSLRDAGGQHRSQAIASIRQELDERVMQLRHQGKLLEAQRLLARTKYDIEMLLEVGYCSGIENYSRHLNGKRRRRSKPYTLVDYFPDERLPAGDRRIACDDPADRRDVRR